MTDQTQRLEIATVKAEVGSNILHRFSNDPINGGGIPTESGDIHNLKQVIAEIQEEGSEKISFATTIYPTTAAGISATTNGAIFLVASIESDEIYAVWQNNSGVAVDTGKRALSSQAIEDAMQSAIDSADAAQESADSAVSRTARFISPKSTDPVVRDDGDALQFGDRYVNTVNQAEYIYKNSSWELNDSLQAVESLELDFHSYQSSVSNTSNPSEGAALVGRGGEAVDSIKSLLACSVIGLRHVSVASYHDGWGSRPAGPLGGSIWAWDPMEPKANHNGFDKISPTVPWNGAYATMSDFQSGTGETQPGATGCWLRIQGDDDIVSWGCLPIPGVDNFSALSKAIAWAYTNKRKLKANSGAFEYGTTLDLDYPTLCLSGNGFRNTVFKYTGTNTAMQADGLRPNAGIYSIDLDLSDFTIEGNADTTDLLRCRINHVRIVRINVREASPVNGCGLHIMGGVANHIEQFTCSTGTQLMTSRPANGIIFDANPLIEGGTRPTCNNLISPCIEGMLGDGIVLKSCDNLTVLGGTSENHDGVGLSEFSGCQMNTFIGMDNEANRGYADWIIAGQGTRLINCGSTKNFYIDNSARLTRVEGGWFDRVEVAAGAVAVTLDGLKVRFFGGVTGLITNNNPFLSTKNIFDVAANTFVFYSKPATGIALAVSPMTYTNSNITEETILIVGGTVTQLAYVRLGTPYLLNPSSGWIRLQPGDGITISYSGTPVITRVPGGTNNQ